MNHRLGVREAQNCWIARRHDTGFPGIDTATLSVARPTQASCLGAAVGTARVPEYPEAVTGGG
jgi:hypothetical protein